MNDFEKRIYSQNGEDGILEIVFDKIGTENKFFVEFGTGDGSECNSRYLREDKGWKGLGMDAEYNNKWVRREQVTAENVEKLFAKYRVPAEFDLLSIDIDGNDYWVWKAIKNFSPRAVVIEYNAGLGVKESVTIRYRSGYTHDGSGYFGASLPALVKLGEKKGYRLVGCDSRGVNAFFVRSDLVGGNFRIGEVEKLFRSARAVYSGKTPVWVKV